MIEKRRVQWYAAESVVDLDIAEREIVLTYVLRILADKGLLERLAFKGGTAIRKLHLGRTGRFSLDLDFSAQQGLNPEDLVLDFVTTLQEQPYWGLNFAVADTDYYATTDSCGLTVTYQHAWAAAGRFEIQISFRAALLLPATPAALLPERYFEWLEFDLPLIPALHLHEMLGEKIRAATQRCRVRDLYDLYQFARHPYNRAQVRRIAVLKCWETRTQFEPQPFLEGLATAKYDWADLKRLVRRDRLPTPALLIQEVQQAYGFLCDLTPEEAALVVDPYGREMHLHAELAESLRLTS